MDKNMKKKLRVLQKKHKRKNRKKNTGGLNEISENLSEEIVVNKEQDDFDIAKLD